MRLLFQHFEQIPIHFSERAYCAETKRTKVDQGKSTIHKGNIWSSNHQDIRWKHLQYNAMKTQLYAKCSNIGYSQ